MRIVTLSQLSLAGSSGIAEAKIPLWSADGTNALINANNGTYLVADGSSSLTNTYSSPTSNNTLFNLSSNTPTSVQFAIESTIYVASASGGSSVQLYDITTKTLVANVSVNTTSTTATVVRSGKATLTPGHAYGVAVISGTAGTIYIVDASLIIFP